MTSVSPSINPLTPGPSQPEGPAFVLTPARGGITGDVVLAHLTRGAAAVVILMLVSLVGVLAYASIPSIQAFGASFLVSSEWRANELNQPRKGPDGNVVIEDGEVVMDTLPPVFGALPVIFGTAVSSALALAFAVPVSLGAALFLVRIAPGWMKGPVSFLIEFLAAIPSIAYGIWGLFVLVPFLQRYVEPPLNHFFAATPGLRWLSFDATPTGRDLFAGGLILGIMIVPIITAVGRDILRGVPRAQVEGTVALGATWWQSAKEMLKYSRSGLFGAIMLGLARAAGETMAVTMVIGNKNQISASLFAPAQTMSSLLASEFAEASDIQRSALMEVALILLLMSLLFNVIARYLVVGKNARTAAAH